MTIPRTALLALALGVTLAGCQANSPEPAANGTAAPAAQGTVAKAMAEAANKLQTENITVRSDDGTSRKAEITPAGDLVIDGKPVAINESQRRLLLEYRARISDIAQAGMAIGTAGAELAGKAVTEALGGIFSGHPNDVGKRVEAQAEGIKTATRALCDRLPAMYEAQRKVAAAVPEFAPFAKSKSVDSAQCRHDVDAHDSGTTPTAPPAPPAPPAPAA